MKTLWLITARSGSKSIPDKNIRMLGGYPLLAYRAKSVLSFAEPEDVWISTDSRSYADIALEFGVHAPFLRPEHLASDTAASIDVVLHAMNYASGIGRKYDAIAVLEPTSPFVKPSTLSDALKKLESKGEASAVVATRYVRPNSFFVQEESEYLSTLSARLLEVDGSRRQDFKEEITPSGGFYISRWDDMLKNKSFYTSKTLSYIVDETESLEIDEPLDWQWANFLIQAQLVSPSDFGLGKMKKRDGCAQLTLERSHR